jgi:hypothetical protein
MKKINILISLIIVLTLKLYAQYQFPYYIQDSIRIEMNWTCTPMKSGQIVVYDPCQGNWALRSSADSLGHTSLKIPGVLPGAYDIYFKITLDSEQVADLSYSVYYNEVLKDEGSYQLTGPANGEIAQYFTQFHTPYAKDFDINNAAGNTSLCLSSNKEIDISASNSCNSEGFWVCESEPVYWNIVSEGDYVSLYNGNIELGNSYSALYPAGSSISVRQKKLCTDTVDRYANISITWGNITKQTSVLLNRFIPSVNLRFDDDYIASGNSTWGAISLENPEMRMRSILPGGCHYTLPTDAFYKVEILNGEQYISFIDPTKDGTCKIIDSLAQQNGNAEFKIIADGTAPLQPVTATIRVSSSVLEIKDSIRTIVINPAPIRAVVDPPMIGIGDTASITVQRLNENGVYENFPDDQQYEVGMAEGCVWGDILAKPAGGEFTKNNYFASVVKPIMFVAADSLADDGGTVKLDIGIVESSNEKVKHKTIDTSWQRIKNELEKFYAAKSGMRHVLSRLGPDTLCYIAVMNSSAIVVAQCEAVNNIEIISPSNNSPKDTISNEPHMPAVICKARLKTQTSGPIKFSWNYIVENRINRSDKKDHPIRTLCPRISKFMFSGLSYINSGQEISIWNVPFNLDSLSYMIVIAPLPQRYHVNKKGDTVQTSYPGNCDKQVLSWAGDGWNSRGETKHIRDRLITGKDIFVGGKVSVSVIARDANNKIVGYGFIRANRIAGKNPSQQQILNFSDDEEVRAIMRTESSKSQFKSIHYDPDSLAGIPIYGPPNGFGLMQIDNSPTPHEADLWNWKQNFTDGIARYYVGRDSALAYIKRKNAAYADSIVRMNAWQNYNGGNNKLYYIYNKGEHKWKISPDIKVGSENDYAGRVRKNYRP